MQDHGLYDDTNAQFVLFIGIEKMYGKDTQMDKIRKSALIDTSFDISRVIVIIALRFLEHIWHNI